MPCAIEKLNSEWVVFAGGAAILRCARADMAREITRMAREQMARLADENAADEGGREHASASRRHSKLRRYG